MLTKTQELRRKHDREAKAVESTIQTACAKREKQRKEVEELGEAVLGAVTDDDVVAAARRWQEMARTLSATEDSVTALCTQRDALKAEFKQAHKQVLLDIAAEFEAKFADRRAVRKTGSAAAVASTISRLLKGLGFERNEGPHSNGYSVSRVGYSHIVSVRWYGVAIRKENTAPRERQAEVMGTLRGLGYKVDEQGFIECESE